MGQILSCQRRKGEKLFNLRVKAYIEYIENALKLIDDNHNAW